MKNNNDHWFFELLEILYNADLAGDGVTWEDFWEKFKQNKSEKILKKQKEYIKTIFFDVSESCSEIKDKYKKTSKDKSKEEFQEKSIRHLKTKMYERYVGHLELQNAYKSSKESKDLAWIAIYISIILGILSFGASVINIYYSQKQLKIAQKQINARILLSEDIEKKIISIENINRSIVEDLKKYNKK